MAAVGGGGSSVARSSACAASATLERLRRVAQRGLDHRPRLPDRLRVAREVHDQRAAADAGHPAGEDPERRVGSGLGPDRLRVAGGLALDHRERGLWGHVVGRHPGPSGGEHEAGRVLVAEATQRSRDRLAVVRHHLVHHLEPGGAAALGERIARAVIASISTPVWAEVRASLVIVTVSSPTSAHTSTNDSGRGWHSGTRSAVRFAAWMPAMRAVPSTSPLGASPRATAAAVLADMRTTARATARRSVTGLAP